jgi:hypothetical protein
LVQVDMFASFAFQLFRMRKVCEKLLSTESSLVQR